MKIYIDIDGEARGSIINGINLIFSDVMIVDVAAIAQVIFVDCLEKIVGGFDENKFYAVLVGPDDCGFSKESFSKKVRFISSEKFVNDFVWYLQSIKRKIVLNDTI